MARIYLVLESSQKGIVLKISELVPVYVKGYSYADL